MRIVLRIVRSIVYIIIKHFIDFLYHAVTTKSFLAIVIGKAATGYRARYAVYKVNPQAVICMTFIHTYWLHVYIYGTQPEGNSQG